MTYTQKLKDAVKTKPMLLDLSQNNEMLVRGLSAVRVLAALSRVSPAPFNGLSKFCGISTAAMTGLADRLTKMGLAERVGQMGDDRRTMQLAITDKGRAEIKKLLK